MKIFLQVFSFFKSIILENIFKGIFKFNYEHVLHNIDNQVKKSVKKQKLEEVKIMFGPSFCVYPPSYVSDKLLSIALQLKGAKIIPIYCDAIQTIECNYFGGEWGGGNFLKEIAIYVLESLRNYGKRIQSQQSSCHPI